MKKNDENYLQARVRDVLKSGPTPDPVKLWTVYDEDGDIVDVDVTARNVADALAQFGYASDAWYAIPQHSDGSRVGGADE